MTDGNNRVERLVSLDTTGVDHVTCIVDFYYTRKCRLRRPDLACFGFECLYAFKKNWGQSLHVCIVLIVKRKTKNEKRKKSYSLYHANRAFAFRMKSGTSNLLFFVVDLDGDVITGLGGRMTDIDSMSA